MAYAQELIDEASSEILSVSHEIFEHPELAYHEEFASNLLEQTLQAHGFHVRRGEGELHTALRAEHDLRSNGTCFAFIGEYDALPIGHACGHNLIAASGMAAAIAFDRLIRQFDLPASSIFLGTPAEEGGGGKIKMLETDMFDSINYAMMIHPCDATMVEDWSLAGQTLTFRFHGRSAHCAASPWLGANALAAAMETVNMVNAWRSQFKDYSRVFPNITHGGEATNVIPDFAELKYNVRSDDLAYHREITSIVENCAQCAAKAFGVTVEVERSLAYAPVANSPVLEEYMAKAFCALGETVIPRYRDHGIGSTDMGNVTQRLPAIHGHMFLAHENTHTAPFREAAGDERGKKYVLKAAKAMVMTAAGIVLDQKKEANI